MDRISNMPDSVLCKILSYLPTKEAVATSILSTKWKNIFPFGVPIKLELDDCNYNNSPSTSFVEFVDRLLNKTLSDVHCMDLLDLTCINDYGDAKIASWIRAAKLLNVQKLSLKFHLKDSKILYQGLNGCTTLSHLVLSGTCIRMTWHVPDNFRLPNLKILCLSSVNFDDDHDDLTESDFFWVDACPALEGLLLNNCFMKFETLFCIRSPMMKILSIQNCIMDPLILDCPNLESFSCTVSSVKGNYPSKFKSPLNVRLDVACHWVDEVAKLLAACSNTTNLSLSSRLIYALHVLSVPLPVFQNLSRLSLDSLASRDWSLLARLLSNTPKLVQLTIEERCKGNNNKEEYQNFQKSLSGPLVCLELSMNYFQFWASNGDEDEIKLIEYFLKNGQVLREITICGLPPDDRSIARRLLLFPRRSKLCQIVIK